LSTSASNQLLQMVNARAIALNIDPAELALAASAALFDARTTLSESYLFRGKKPADTRRLIETSLITMLVMNSAEPEATYSGYLQPDERSSVSS
jgi:hypothetical protein